jgi:prepilin-type N-terminal cleavage/methylation domain-containing protein
MISAQFRTDRRGFTLLELLITVTIIGVVMGVAVPLTYGWLRMQHLSDTVDELRTDWIKARTIAMDEGRPYRFQITGDNLSYRLAPNEWSYWPDQAQGVNAPTFGDEEDAGAWTLEKPLKEGIRFEVTPGDTVGLGGNADATWLFMPDGTAKLLDQDGHEHQQASIMIVSDDGRRRQLQVRALTAQSMLVKQQ